MLFNVCDQAGKHLGILTYIEAFRETTTAVALTDLSIQDVSYNRHQLMERVAQYMDAKTLLGKVNEVKLEEKLRETWKQDFSTLGNYDLDFALKLMLIKKHRYNDITVEIDPSHIKGYLLLDKSDVKFADKDTIIIDQELDYIPTELDVSLEGEYMIYGRVVDYPVMSLSVMGVSEGLLLGANLSDFGGRNHSHYTQIEMRSGNFTRSVFISMPIYVKKDMPIYISMKKGSIESIFVDGVIYKGY